ncbi:SDR family NAD(P)-dependent oxidoreductase, partial [Mesorhizobium sp.]|uniref:SDR family NAD(P)-dependent oxidoreductase n=1 Tax=Mesorhizobium sp. TaxID=1871066 RepID=UPI000FE7AA40
MTPSLSLTGRRAIVSAAASGIGRVIAETLAEAGARVEVCDVDQQKVAELRQRHPAIGATYCDLADATDTERFFEGAVE